MLRVMSSSVHLLYCQLQAVYYLLLSLLINVLTWPKEKLFATEDNLELELCQLEREALANEKMVQTQDDNEVPEVKVTEMSEKALKINLSLKKKGKVVVPPDECNEDEIQPSPDIEVICERQSRHLHGILKQRSRSHSESSDDVSSAGAYSRENSTSSGSHMSESPISESEEAEGSLEGRLKKSVSFSDHVDKATFKPGATVSSMTTVLKSKRRRNRKREEKKRRRHSSTGSEYSSSDEHPHHQDSDAGDETHGKNKGAEKAAASKSAAKQKSGATVKPGKVDDKVASLDEAYRTSEKNVKPSAQCDSSDGVQQGMSPEGVSTEGCPEGKGEGSHGDTKLPGMPGQSPTTTRTKPEADSSTNQTQSCDINGGDDSTPDPQSKAGGDSTDVESMLSWKEQEDPQSQQHKTQCAFSFSNSVMFDLDVD